jgi:hypothetical protein
LVHELCDMHEVAVKKRTERERQEKSVLGFWRRDSRHAAHDLMIYDKTGNGIYRRYKS